MNVQEIRRLKKDSDDFQRMGFSFPGDFDKDLCLCACDPLRLSPSKFPFEPAGKNPNQNLRIRTSQNLIDVRGSSERGEVGNRVSIQRESLCSRIIFENAWTKIPMLHRMIMKPPYGIWNQKNENDIR